MKNYGGYSDDQLIGMLREGEREIADYLVDKYKNRSESSLMDELLRVTEQQKQDGTLDSAGIQAAANSILPMLNAEQAKKLNAILSKIT